MTLEAQYYRDLIGRLPNSTVTVITKPDSEIIHYHPDNEKQIVNFIHQRGKETNVHINMNPRRLNMPASKRGVEDDVSYLCCIYADCDVKGPAHKAVDLPPDKKNVLEFFDNWPLPPTYFIDSGHGIYAIWMFAEPIPLRCDEDRIKAKGTYTGYGKYLISQFKEHSWSLDNTFDIPRMLRAPGSMNHKTEPAVECQVLSFNNHYYTLDDFAEYYEATATIDRLPFEADKRTVGSDERIMENCLFMQKMLSDPDGVTEPEWKAQCSNAVLTSDGAEKFHEWSSHYTGYSFDETEHKIECAQKAKKPCTCAYIQEQLGFKCPEGGCGVKAPIVLAQYTKQEQIHNLLEKSPLTAEDVLEDYALNLAAYAKEHCPADYSRIKLKVKKTGVSLRDFERAVSNEAEKCAEPQFDIIPKEIIIDGIDLHGAVEPNNYQVSLLDGVTSTYYVNGESMTACLCHEPVVIKGRLENIDSGQEKMEVLFHRNNRWKKLIAPRSALLNKNVLIKLSDSGLPVTSDNAEGVVRYLAAYEAANTDVIPFTRSINRIGWIGKEFYPCAIDSEIIYEGDDEDNIISAIVERGDYDLWLNTALELRKNTFSRALMDASFASPLLEPLQHRVFAEHIWYSSRSGKTAGLKFALSIWGDPMKLMGNFNSTAVGLERRAGILKHLPLGLDELQVLNEKRLSASTIVYTLGNGFGKTRGAKDGGLQGVPTWRNCIICTGEQPLSNENSMDGVGTRVLELYGAPISDAEFGRTVHQISESNFGFAGKHYIDNIRNEILTNKEKLRNKYDNIREKLRTGFAGDPGAHLDNIAVLTLADYYSSVCIFGMDEETSLSDALLFGNTVLINAKSLEKEDVVERAWHFTESWIATNRSRFDSTISPCYGKIESKRVYLIASVLRQALEENGFNYTKSIKGFKDRGYIDTFSNSKGAENTQVQKKIQGVNVRTICALLNVEAYENDFLADPVEPLVGKTAIR